MNKGRNCIFIIICSLVLILAGCESNEFKKTCSDFDAEYYKVAKSIDIEHTYNSLEKLQADDNIKSINEMGKLLEKMKDETPRAKRKTYDKYKKQYDGLLFLSDAYKKWDSLTKDEKRRINYEIWLPYHLYKSWPKENKQAN